MTHPLTLDELDRVEAIVEGLEPGFAAIWSCWPNYCCVSSSLLIAPILRAAMGIEFKVAAGWAFNRNPHAWIETPAGDIIDPTFGQFDGDAALRIWSAGTRAGHEAYKLLDLVEEEEGRQRIRTEQIGDFGSAPVGTVLPIFNEIKEVLLYA